MRICRLGLTGVVLAAMIGGCGGDENTPVEKSPYAPTQDQMKAMQEGAMKNIRIKSPAKKH